MENTNVTVSNTDNRKKFSRTLRVLGIALAVVILVYGLLSYIGRPYDKGNSTYIDVTIAKGASTEEISQTLVDNGIIGNAGSFRFISAVSMYNDKFKPGIYSLSPSMNMSTIASTLIKGITTDDGFVIPAGYTVEQLATALDQAGYVDKEKFLYYAYSGIYSSQFDFLGGSSSVEGFLLPARYVMSKDADENMIITTMLYQFDSFFTDEYRQRAAELGLSTRDVVIIASLVEKQAKSDKEMPAVAGDIISRINSGIGVEGGYPDKPLCSPGTKAIEAVLWYEIGE